MKKTAIALALLASASLAQAQSKNFEGFYLGAAVNLQSTSVDVTNNGWSDTGIDGAGAYDSSRIGGKNNVIPSLDLSYTLAVDSKWLITFGGTYDLSKNKLGTSHVSSFDAEEETIGIYGVKGKQKGHYSIYVAPGYLVTNSTMVYAKFAHHQSKIDYEVGGIEAASDGSLAVGGEGFSEKYKGMGYGVGLKTQLTDKVFAFAEVQQVTYKSKDNAKPSSTIGTIGVQYKF
jgi:opacity protein-like surface antigen